MRVILEREVDRIKSGSVSRCPALRVAAHGYSVEMADRNLENLVRRFLAPFERAGVLTQELSLVGLRVDEEHESGVRVAISGQ